MSLVSDSSCECVMVKIWWRDGEFVFVMEGNDCMVVFFFFFKQKTAYEI